MKASRRSMKCDICYSEELEKVCNIEDEDERFYALNDFFHKIQSIVYRETKINFLRKWRKFNTRGKSR